MNYNNITIFRHLFPSLPEDKLLSTKVDLMFDSTFFDRFLFGFEYDDHRQLTQFINMFSTPVFFMIAMVDTQQPKGILNMY